MKQDKFLLGILVFIGLLVIAAVGLFFVRNQAPAYGPEDTPQGVLLNYALALQLKDYERAYSYLQIANNEPTLEAFRQAFLNRQLDISNSALQIGEVTDEDEGQTWVFMSVTMQYAGSGPFNPGWSNRGYAHLVKQNGVWKIADLPYPYWGGDWYQPTPVYP